MKKQKKKHPNKGWIKKRRGNPVFLIFYVKMTLIKDFSTSIHELQRVWRNWSKTEENKRKNKISLVF
ncbi:hypothetical protein CHI10_13635 [Bacillus sp. 7894-2]|nr:hypothetical protein CHI10_13635 [Bacillus sp. 7894-2]